VLLVEQWVTLMGMEEAPMKVSEWLLSGSWLRLAKQLAEL
jgi:hypothetical protein